MSNDNGKEHDARWIAENLLDGAAYVWSADAIYTLLERDGWRWNGAQWKQRPQQEATR